jgi:hypothetical protein
MRFVEIASAKRREETMFKKSVWLFVAFMLVAAAQAEAAPRIEIRPFAGLRFGGNFSDGVYSNVILDDLDVKPGSQFGVVANVRVTPANSRGSAGFVEVLFNYQKSDLRFEPSSLGAVPDTIRSRFTEEDGKLIIDEVKVMYLHFGGLYRFGDYSGWRPYVNGGLGATIFEGTDLDASETEFSFSFGGGMQRMFSETIGVRLQLRGYATTIPANEIYWCDRYGCWTYTDTNWFLQGELSAGLIVAL